MYTCLIVLSVISIIQDSSDLESTDLQDPSCKKEKKDSTDSGVVSTQYARARYNYIEFLVPFLKVLVMHASGLLLSKETSVIITHLGCLLWLEQVGMLMQFVCFQPNPAHVHLQAAVTIY